MPVVQLSPLPLLLFSEHSCQHSARVLSGCCGKGGGAEEGLCPSTSPTHLHWTSPDLALAVNCPSADYVITFAILFLCRRNAINYMWKVLESPGLSLQTRFALFAFFKSLKFGMCSKCTVPSVLFSAHGRCWVDSPSD